MARKKNKRIKKAQAADAMPGPVSRRETMARLAWFGVGGAAVLGVGGAVAMDFRNKMAEGDLSRIGLGVPTVVQIHDPACALCRDLQREARAAMKRFDEGELLYLVANIQALDGADFQARMGLPNVSLVMLDGDGNRAGHVQGVTPRAELEQIFRTRLGL